MPRRYTVTDLVLRCQQRVNMENDPSISRPEWLNLISEAYGELYSIVFEVGNEYFEYTESLTTDGTNVFAEIADHLSTVALSLLLTGDPNGQRVDLRPAEAMERSRLSGVHGGAAEYFALVDDKIYLYPTPPAGQVYELRYVPQPPELAEFSGGLSVDADVVTPDGLAFLIWCVAAKALAKGEEDVTNAVAEREAARMRFTESAVLRAISTGHHRVVDRGGGMLDGFYDGYRDSADWNYGR